MSRGKGCCAIALVVLALLFPAVAFAAPPANVKITAGGGRITATWDDPERGAPGPCTGMKPGEIVQKLRADAQLHATAASGFIGDPLHLLGRYFGYLVSAEQSTLPPPPPPAPPAPPATPTKARAPSCRVPKLRGLTRRQSKGKLKRAGCRYRSAGTAECARRLRAADRSRRRPSPCVWRRGADRSDIHSSMIRVPPSSRIR